MEQGAPSKPPDKPKATGPTDQQATLQMLKGFIQPWKESLADPAAAQNRVLQSLLRVYASTEYGARYGASQIQTTG